jgi:hypothetical protein
VAATAIELTERRAGRAGGVRRASGFQNRASARVGKGLRAGFELGCDLCGLWIDGAAGPGLKTCSC